MPAPVRFSAFDALRAGAMELGLVLHAAVPYTRACPETWVACDPARSASFDVLNTVIHAFRMPVFFLMSGFFAALLLQRVGRQAFIRHRLRRIGLPLTVAVLTLVPLIRAIWLVGQFERAADPLVGDPIASLRAHFVSQGLRVFETLWHLWFLEYLLILTAGYLVVRAAGGITSVERVLDRLAGWLVSPARAAVLAIPTMCMMATMQGWNVDGVGDLVPVPRMLAYYAVFFAAGVLLYRRRDELEGLRAGWRVQLAAALGVVLPAMLALASLGTAQPAVDLAGRALSGLLSCLLLYGIVGLYVELFDGESPRQRYMADAAYFIYLAHFPLIAALGVAVGHLDWPAFAKFALVLGTTAPILLGLYHVGVRHTLIGRVLHGPRP